MAKRTLSAPAPTPADFMKQSVDWYQYCWQWWEMMAAASLTIGMRTTGIADRMSRNQAPDFAEGWRMVAEKNQAWLRSAAAAAPWVQYWSQALAAQASGANANKAPDLISQQFQFGKLMLQSLTATMQPFHKASTANAFRLSGKRASASLKRKPK